MWSTQSKVIVTGILELSVYDYDFAAEWDFMAKVIIQRYLSL